MGSAGVRLRCPFARRRSLLQIHHRRASAIGHQRRIADWRL